MGEPNNPPLLDSQQDPNQAGDATVYGTEITLRDLFAGMAMQALVGNRELMNSLARDVKAEAWEHIACGAYDQADAMLKRREQ